jgi:hypothetical protein
VQNSFAASDFTSSFPPGAWWPPLVFRLRNDYQQFQYCRCANLSSACNATSAPAPEGPVSLFGVGVGG